jgi:hypothetical protein
MSASEVMERGVGEDSSDGTKAEKEFETINLRGFGGMCQMKETGCKWKRSAAKVNRMTSPTRNR